MHQRVQAGGATSASMKQTKNVHRNDGGGVRKRSAGGLWVNLSFRFSPKCFVNIIIRNHLLLRVDLPVRTYRFNATSGSRRVQTNNHLKSWLALAAMSLAPARRR